MFSGSNDPYVIEKQKSNLEVFFNYFILISEQKYHYAQMKLVGKTYCWGERQPYRLSMLVYFNRSFSYFASYILYSSEVVYKESEAVDQPEPESEAADEPDPQPSVLVEPVIVDEPNSMVVDEAKLQP